MKILRNVKLKSKNTFHIEGMATNYYIPENENDLLELMKVIGNNKAYVLSGGSNILINDKKMYDHIIDASEIDKSFEQIENEIFYIGASLRVQDVINRLNSCGYGGIEKFYSLPALFGGIIYMNAGIGSRKNPVFTISDFIVKVKVFNKEIKKIEWIKKEECLFGHRKSVFQNDKYIIMGAECNFIEQDLETSKQIIKDRISNFSKKAEMGRGTFGTIFSVSNDKLLKVTSLIHKKKGKIHFGEKNKNWLVNDGDGTYNDAIYLINKCKKIHKIFHKKIECEVRIWE